MNPFHKENTFITAWQQNNHKRNAYRIDWTAHDAPLDEVLYIPLNRLSTPYQTEKATNWDKVHENAQRMANGDTLAPIVIGYSYDVHDGHHRLEASKLMQYTHVPCIVGGNDVSEVRRALAAYQEIWKSFYTAPLIKAVLSDPSGNDPFTLHNQYMYRGIGLTELQAIQKNGYIQSKGKGNDADKDRVTCFTHLITHAEAYARSNYDLYHEPEAFVIALPKPAHVPEDEHGEIVLQGPVSIQGARLFPIARGH